MVRNKTSSLYEYRFWERIGVRQKIVFSNIKDVVMKKYIIVIFFLSAVRLFAQANGTPFSGLSGYGNLPWGTAVNTFWRMNPAAKEITKPEELAVGVEAFIVWVHSDGVKARQYRFFNNKLYSVLVEYEIIYDTLFLKALSGRLTDLYGRPHDIEKNTSEFWQDKDYYTQNTRFYWYLKTDLTITYLMSLIYQKEQDYSVGFQCAVGYINPLMKAEVEEAKTKKAKGKVQL